MLLTEPFDKFKAESAQSVTEQEYDCLDMVLMDLLEQFCETMSLEINTRSNILDDIFFFDVWVLYLDCTDLSFKILFLMTGRDSCVDDVFSWYCWSDVIALFFSNKFLDIFSTVKPCSSWCSDGEYLRFILFIFTRPVVEGRGADFVLFLDFSSRDELCCIVTLKCGVDLYCFLYSRFTKNKHVHERTFF